MVNLAIRIVVFAALSIGSALPAQATPDPALWDCAKTLCTELTARDFATLSGTFAHGARLDNVAQADQIAALEQQSLREFEFAISEAGVINGDLSLAAYRPADWDGPDLPVPLAELSFWVSVDGETYVPGAPGLQVAAGDILLVGVRQARRDDAKTVSYFPARFSLVLSQARVQAETTLEVGVPQLPSLISADEDPAPEDLSGADGSVPAVTGQGQLTNIAEPCDGTGCAGGATSSAPRNELAAELQRELARVGCYGAAVDGLWGPASRAAVAAYNGAVGASLDAATPSPATLVAVARSQGAVCTGN